MDADQQHELVEVIVKNPRFRYAIIGPEGTGKTVLMEDLASQVRDKEWVRIQEEDPPSTFWRAARRLRDKKDTRILFFDGGEILPKFFWSRLWLRRKKLVATTHSFRPQLNVLHKTEYQPDIAISMITHLLGRRLTSDERRKIYDWGECCGNMREILRMCYRSDIR